MGGTGQPKTSMDMIKNRTTPAKRRAAAKRAAAKRDSNPLSRLAVGNGPIAGAAALISGSASAATTFSPQGTPDYFGTTPNYANSPLPDLDANGAVIPGTGIRKFVDSLPGLGVTNKNNLGQYLTVAVPDTTTYPGSDYYIIGLVEYSQKLHSDLPPTKLRGYVQLNSSGVPMTAPSYLGPTIVAQRDRPTRVKFINKLPTGAGGDLFIPTDTTAMGAGVGPDGVSPYKQNRATIHLHGGATPWISDGTPHQWTTPAGENTAYPKGVSVVNVPDMPDPGPGALTFFYTNQQSARLMFYHDHAYGLTRLNVYAGEAAGYVLSDPVEQKLVKGGTIGTVTVAPGTVPADQMPLIIQDKTFVPKDAQLLRTDPTWDRTKWGSFGSLWFPHVYMPNQNPNDESGANAMGRYDYGPLFWPIFHPTHDINADGTPAVPNVSLVPEAFMDTPLVNGTPYPFVKVGRKAYRFRILNASNDRMWNLQLYYAASNTPASVNGSGMPTLQTTSGEVPMVPAVPHANDPAWPATWPTDGREGGVPDPAAAGPKWIQIGTEGGILPKPAVIDQQPVGYNYNRRDIVVLNIANKSLFLGPAERADVIVDFSQVPAGSKIIMYNDAPAPVPAFDTRLDYYTGDPDQRETGGAPTTKAGYGPNTRTIMQFQVEGATAAPAFDTAALDAALPAAFKASQDPIIVPQTAYPGSALTTDTFSKIQSTVLTFTPEGTSTPVGVFMQPKAIQELFEMDYGRMNATLGVELPFTNSGNQTTLPMGFTDPTTENFTDSVNTTTALIGTAGDGTQIWKITHNGVDTHAIHFHLFNVQIINRVGWDGAIRPPNPNELGWKETVLMNPLEDCIVAMRPVSPKLPFKVGDSVRPNDPTMPLGSTQPGWDPKTGQPITVTNTITNFGWEYVWHCHLLGHEENDMMRPIIFAVAPAPPTALSAVPNAGPQVTLAWTKNWTLPAATNVLVQRATNSAFTAGVTNYPTLAAAETGYVDTAVQPGTQYYYRVRAENANSYSAWTNVAGAKTPATSGAPLAPTNLVIGIKTRTSIAIAWANPAGSSVTTNVVEYSTVGPNGPWTTGATLGPTATQHVLTGLRNNTTYWIRVKAINGSGATAYSAVSGGKTPR
jgi:FtsP/CotA-like multicopper oxidase with cupredoxin domain